MVMVASAEFKTEPWVDSNGVVRMTLKGKYQVDYFNIRDDDKTDIVLTPKE